MSVAPLPPLPPELRDRVLAAVQREPVPTREAGARRRARAVALGFGSLIAALAFLGAEGPRTSARVHRRGLPAPGSRSPRRRRGPAWGRAARCWAVRRAGSVAVVALTPVALLAGWAAVAMAWPSTFHDTSGPHEHLVCDLATFGFSIGPLLAFRQAAARHRRGDPTAHRRGDWDGRGRMGSACPPPRVRIHRAGAHSPRAHRPGGPRHVGVRASDGAPRRGPVVAGGRWRSASRRSKRRSLPMATGPVRVLMVSSEVESLARTGGLGDAVEALSRSLASLGADVVVATPKYGVSRVPAGARSWPSPVIAPLGLGHARTLGVLETRLAGLHRRPPPARRSLIARRGPCCSATRSSSSATASTGIAAAPSPTTHSASLPCRAARSRWPSARGTARCRTSSTRTIGTRLSRSSTRGARAGRHGPVCRRC